MIVVRIELWPGGDNTKARSMGIATISNVGAVSTRGAPIARGIYEVKLYSAGQKLTPVHEGTVYNFRRRSFGAWYLLAGALASILPWKDAFDGEPTVQPPVIPERVYKRRSDPIFPAPQPGAPAQ